MKIGTVCSGIGAPEVAFGRHGFESIWHSEIEKFPSAVLAHHYPDVPNLGDFTTDEAIEHMVANHSRTRAAVVHRVTRHRIWSLSQYPSTTKQQGTVVSVAVIKMARATV